MFLSFMIQSETQRYVKEIEEMKDLIVEATSELKDKDQLHQQLVSLSEYINLLDC